MRQGEAHNLLGFSGSAIRLLTLLYVCMLVYGTLFPLQGWVSSNVGIIESFLQARPGRLSKADLVTNFLVYLPLGMLCMGLFARRWHWPIALALTVFLGTSLSLALEVLQVFLPNRVPSLADLFLNGVGSFVGGILGVFLLGQTVLGLKLHDFRQERFKPGRLADLGLFVLVLWGLSQLIPLVPSLDLGTLKQGLKPAWLVATGQTPLVKLQVLEYFSAAAGLGTMVLTLGQSRRFGLFFFSLLILSVLALKVPVVSRQLSLEALLGCCTALLVLWAAFRRCSDKTLGVWSMALLVVSFLAQSLRYGLPDAPLYRFNWMPFAGHMSNIVGLADILWGCWIFMGLGYAARILSPSWRSNAVAWWGGVGVFCLAFWAEWMQRNIPGRSPDITDALVAVAAWGASWVGSGLFRRSPENGVRLPSDKLSG